jgi:hypothetical protein
MSRRLAGAVIAIALYAGAAAAQIPGDSPSSGIGSAVANSHSRPILGISRQNVPRYSDEERQYETAVRGIPDGKPARDPWGNIRRGPTAAAPAYDRHRVD